MLRIKSGLFVLICLLGFIQLVQADESTDLWKVLSTKIPDTTRVNTLNSLSREYVNDSPDSAIQIAYTARELAQKVSFKRGLALANKNIGMGYYLQGKYLEALTAWEEALALFTELGDKRGIANMMSNEAAIYFNQGDEAKSLEYDLQALKISEEINDTLRIVTSLNNIGTLYLNKTSTYPKALEKFTKAYHLSKAIKDQYLIGTASVNLGETYYKMNDDAQSLVYLKEALIAFDGTPDLPGALNYMGKVYTRKQDFSKALETHQRAYEYAKNLDTKLDMTQSLIGLAQTYSAQKDYTSAIQAFLKALDIARPVNFITEIKDIYEGLSTAYSAKREYENAFTYQTLLLQVKDTIYNVNTDKKLGMLQFAFDLEKKESEINLLTKDKEIQQKEISRQKIVRNSFIGGFIIVLLFAGIFFKQRNRIGKEKKRSDELLLNILPEEVAEELKEKGEAEARLIEDVTVLFTDFKGFTAMSEKLSPKDLVRDIHECFSAFDHIMEKYGIEKIKTIGDAYMAAGGIPVECPNHAVNIIKAAFEIREFIAEGKARKIENNLPFFEIRIGIHSGPVVAGIVGVKKFAYDIWGDTVNTASRMESSGEPGKVNISSTTYAKVKDSFSCEYRGKITAKGKGEIEMYFVEPLG
ncbi:MAG TPA: adenylate/guanylate cyclase domain-containing protein [Flavobacteriales bacterium]|nr:adenylate/guanylate cyclase domain-containing protein [Flavobacteriales bacterium]